MTPGPALASMILQTVLAKLVDEAGGTMTIAIAELEARGECFLSMDLQDGQVVLRHLDHKELRQYMGDAMSGKI